MKYIILLVFISCSTLSFAQLTPGEVKKKAERKVENRANQKVDQAIDKGLDALEGLFKKKSKKPEKESAKDYPTDQPKSSSSETKPTSKKKSDFVPSKNTFLGTVKMEYRFFKNDKEEKHSPMEIEMHNSEDATAMKIDHTDAPSSLMILHLDRDKISVITDHDGQKMAMEMNRPNLAKYDSKIGEYDIQKTGNTKTIDGYRCAEYIITGDDQKTICWATKDLNVDWKAYSESMMAMSKMNKNSKNDYFGEMEGFPIEMTTTFKNGKEKVVIKTLEVKEGTYDASLFDLSGYNMMKIPSFGN